MCKGELTEMVVCIVVCCLVCLGPVWCCPDIASPCSIVAVKFRSNSVLVFYKGPSSRECSLSVQPESCSIDGRCGDSEKGCWWSWKEAGSCMIFFLLISESISGQKALKMAKGLTECSHDLKSGHSVWIFFIAFLCGFDLVFLNL